MKVAQFKRRLEQLGVEIRDGKRHWLLRYGGNVSTLPRHPTKEISNNDQANILKQLGIKNN